MQDSFSGASRSYTKKFQELRKEKNTHKKEAIKRINGKLKYEMHYMQQNKAIETKKSTVMDNFIPTFMATKKVKIFIDAKGDEIDISKIPGCIQCQSIFSLFDEKLQCPACMRIVCNKCLNSKYFVPIPQSLGGKLELCVRCYCLKNKESAILEFKKKIDDCNNDRLILWYTTLISLRKEIENFMPDFSGLVLSLTESNVMIDELSSSNDMGFIEAVFGVQAKANELSKNIEKHFRSIQERLDKISKVEAVTKRDEQIKKLVRIGTGSFLSKFLPEYQTLNEALKKFMTDPIVIATVETYHFKLEDKKEKEKLAVINKKNKIEIPHTPSNTQPNNSTNPFNQEEISVKEPIKLEPKPLEIPKVSSLITQKKTSSSSWLNTLLDGKSNKSPTNVKQEIPKNLPIKPAVQPVPQITLVKPFIESVKPAVVPITGEVMIDIEGINFEPGLEVIIAGVRIVADDIILERDEETGNWHVFLEVPPSTEEGTKTIILINPNKCTAILENVLLYVNDPEILKEFQYREGVV